MRKIFCLIFVVSSTTHFGQLINNQQGEALGDENYFNPIFVAQNGISHLVLSYQVKRDGSPIVKEKGGSVLEFNTLGQLVRETETRLVFSSRDTVITTYEYDGDQLAKTCSGGARRLTCEEFRWDGDVLASICYSRRSLKRPENEMSVNCEERDWQHQSDSLRKCDIVNNYGRAYASYTEKYESGGYLAWTYLSHWRGGWFQETTYDYGERGWVSSKEVIEFGKDKEVRTFSYDEIGNLTELMRTEGDSWEKYEVVYSGNGLVDGVIKTTHANTDIHIINFSYDFFPRETNRR